MQHNENFLKVLYDGIIKHETNHINILFNVLSYLFLIKMVGNTFTLELYEKIYNKNESTSFISTIKSKYNLDIVILERSDIEKIISNKNIISENIFIENIISILNLKNIQYTSYISHSMDVIKPSINNLSDLSIKSSVLIMSSYFGEYNKYLNEINNSVNNLDIFEINNTNAILSQMEYDYNYSTNINIKNQDYIHHNIITKSYDIILCNFPNGLRNIIHANCCDKIKRLKIRGTKSEPLILQLIMMSLNNNGKACIIVPNTLLNNDSKQHIDTRNYLINNFNVTNIINCDNNLSILYFERNGLTKQTTFSKIQDDKIVKLFDVYYDKMVKRNYNLYYEKYINIECNISNICENKKKLINIVDVVEVFDCNNNNYNNCNYLKIPKFLTDNQKVEILFDNCDLNTDNQNDFISLKIKDTSIINQKYFNYYFLYVLSPVLITTTSGKAKKLDINILLDTEINIPNMEIQNNIVEFFDISYLNINQIKKQTKSIQLLKNKFIENIINKYPFVKLSELCNVDAKPNNDNNCDNLSRILCVQRNSKSAGNTFYYDNIYNNDDPLNTNVYYLNNINSKNNLENLNISTLYILLKHNEAKLNKLASITNTINLSKTNLENFEIKNIPVNVQEIINNKINEYDNMILSLVKNVNNLINTNIFSFL